MEEVEEERFAGVKSRLARKLASLGMAAARKLYTRANIGGAKEKLRVEIRALLPVQK